MSLIGDRIIDLREKININQRELALKLKISPSVMNRIESGERPVRDDEIKNIANFFNVSTDYLLGRDVITKDHSDPEIAELLKNNGIKKLRLSRDLTLEELKMGIELVRIIKKQKTSN
jgi:transcriptional regulator with XRE-family HTH domain